MYIIYTIFLVTQVRARANRCRTDDCIDNLYT